MRYTILYYTHYHSHTHLVSLLLLALAIVPHLSFSLIGALEGPPMIITNRRDHSCRSPSKRCRKQHLYPPKKIGRSLGTVGVPLKGDSMTIDWCTGKGEQKKIPEPRTMVMTREKDPPLAIPDAPCAMINGVV